MQESNAPPKVGAAEAWSGPYKGVSTLRVVLESRGRWSSNSLEVSIELVSQILTRDGIVSAALTWNARYGLCVVRLS
jgi:hypothetical protein